MAELLHIFVAGRRACFLLFRPRLSCSKPFPVSRGLPLAILRLLLFVALLCGATIPSRPAAAGSTPDLDSIANQLVSHRALYTISVARLDPRNYRSGITGGLSLEFVNACDGFVLNQRFVIQTDRSEEHTSELQSLMRISYAVFCLK